MSMRVTTAFIFGIAANTIAIGQDAPVRAGATGVSHPHLQQTSVPVYPPFAVAARVSGTVLIERSSIRLVASQARRSSNLFHSSTLLRWNRCGNGDSSRRV